MTDNRQLRPRQIIADLREGRSPGLLASQQRMQELGIGTAVMEAIDREVSAALAALEPFAGVAASPLLRQLAGLLQRQVAKLPSQAVSR